MMKGRLLEQRVRTLLSLNNRYQKSDLALMSRIWYDDLRRIFYGDISSVSAMKFLDMLRKGELTKSESVTRCRRKLQAKHPELRDDKVYKGRKDKEHIMRSKSQFY